MSQQRIPYTCPTADSALQDALYVLDSVLAIGKELEKKDLDCVYGAVRVLHEANRRLRTSLRDALEEADEEVRSLTVELEQADDTIADLEKLYSHAQEEIKELQEEINSVCA